MLLFAKPVSGGSGWSLKRHVNVQGASATATSSPIDTTGADLLVAFGGPNVSALTDNKGNSFLLAVTSTGNCQMFYVRTTLVGLGHTFTGGGSYQPFQVMAFSGSAASPLDQTSASATVGPGSITPSVINCLVVTAACAGSDVYNAVDSGFALLDTQPFVSGTSYALSDAWLAETARVAKNPLWSGPASPYGSVIASFLPGF